MTMTIPNTPNAAERPSDAAILQWLLDHSYLNNGLIDYGAGFTQQRPGIIKGALIDTMNGWHGECQFCRGGQELYADGNPSGEACSHCKGKGNVNELRADDIFYYYEAIAELDSHRPAESVSAEPVAWQFLGTSVLDGPWPTPAWKECADPVEAKKAGFEVRPLYLHPQPSTPGAVSDEWSPTIDDMPEGICVAKRSHVERERHMDNWFVGFGKDESCQIEGTANHWYWLAYALLGLVDEKDSPYSEDKPLPFSPAYIRAALESFAKRGAAATEDGDVARITEDALIGMTMLRAGTPTMFVVSMAQLAAREYAKRSAAPPAQAVSVPDGIAKLANERQPSPHTSHSVSLDVVGGPGCKASVEVTAPAAATREGEE